MNDQYQIKIEYGTVQFQTWAEPFIQANGELSLIWKTRCIRRRGDGSLKTISTTTTRCVATMNETHFCLLPTRLWQHDGIYWLPTGAWAWLQRVRVVRTIWGQTFYVDPDYD